MKSFEVMIDYKNDSLGKVMVLGKDGETFSLEDLDKMGIEYELNFKSDRDFPRNDAYYNLKNLVSVNMHDDVGTIPVGCFIGCNSLTSISMTSKLHFTRPDIFGVCPKLKEIRIALAEGDNDYYKPTLKTIADIAYMKNISVKIERHESSLQPRIKAARDESKTYNQKINDQKNQPPKDESIGIN